MNKWYILLGFLFAGHMLESQPAKSKILPGAYRTYSYLPKLKGKEVGIVVNHSSLIADTHLVDTLLDLNIQVAKVFSPEHGFRGTASDGELVEQEENNQPFELISLYGKNKKPTDQQVEGLEVMVFDIQDVGVRFYTYVGTMHYVMESCAKNNIPLIILDRPNPNGSYVDGPVLDTALRSFVGMHPVPIVHGMTVGEMAKMINSEGWLEDGVTCDLEVIPVSNWDHQMPYDLPVKPSPNLPDALSVALYPTICLFEGTILSVGRGTDFAFQQVGHPEYPDQTHAFTPVSREGSKWPPFENERCYGRSWIGEKPVYAFTIQPVIDAYHQMKERKDFFKPYFSNLAGTQHLKTQIVGGLSEEEIRKTWKTDLENFKQIRSKYLLYN